MNKTKTAQEIFAMQYRGEKNFMTPNILGYGFLKNDNATLAYELSSGQGFDKNIIYGVTVVEWLGGNKGTQMRRDWSQMFDTLEGATEFIKKDYNRN